MKTMRKMMALVLSLALSLTLVIPALAVDRGHTISVAPDDTHTYEVYQIFTADYARGVLSNVKWGANGTDTGRVDMDALEELEDAADTSDREQLDVVVQDYVKLDSTPVGTVYAGHAYTGASSGYYLLKDLGVAVKDESGAVTGYVTPDNDALSLYIVKVLGEDLSIHTKKEVPTIEKTVLDNGGKTAVNEASIGETVTYEMKGHVPQEAAEYDYYYFVVNDRMTAGLTYQNDPAPTVTVGTGNDARALVAGVDYYLYEGAEASGYTFRIALADAVSLAGKDVFVHCAAVVNENAAVGTVANTNTGTLDYSNDANFTYKGTQNERQPGLPDSNRNVPTGKTPGSVTETYVTALTVQKQNEKGERLTGAEFTLTGPAAQVRVVTVTGFEAASDGAYYQLKPVAPAAEPTYTKDAPILNDRMTPAEDGANKGYVAAEEGYDGDDAVTVDGVVYRAYVAGNDSGLPLYVLEKANADLYASTTEKYRPVSGVKVLGENQEQTEVRAFVGEDGTVTFEGLGAGDYTLTETVTPDGYNTIEPMHFKVSFNPETKTFYADNSVTAGADNLLTTIVVNRAGTVLPETGGMGTTLLYAIGGALVIGAGALLLMRKRKD